MDITPTSDQLATPTTAVPQHSLVTAPDTTGVKFAQAMGKAVTVAGQMAANVASGGTLSLAPIAGNIGGNLNVGAGGVGGAGSLGTGDSTSEFQNLLLLQEQIQNQSLEFQSLTNISKTEHESRMSVAQNLRGS